MAQNAQDGTHLAALGGCRCNAVARNGHTGFAGIVDLVGTTLIVSEGSRRPIGSGTRGTRGKLCGGKFIRPWYQLSVLPVSYSHPTLPTNSER